MVFMISSLALQEGLLQGCLRAQGPARTSELPPQEPAAGQWLREEGWRGACFSPFLEQPSSEERALNLRAMSAQWGGQRRDGAALSSETVSEVLELLHSEHPRLQELAQQNQAECRAFMSEELSTLSWNRWLEDVLLRLEEERCSTPFQEPFSLHLELRSGWQTSLELCADQSLEVRFSSDRYRLRLDAPWQDARGLDEGEPPGSELPCPGCAEGALLLRFEGLDGETLTWAPRQGERWRSPAAGSLQVALNAVDFREAQWYEADGVRDRLLLELIPSE